MANPLYFPVFRAFDSNGDPLSGGKVYTYEAGTSTPKDTYTDSTMTTPNTNPVILDSQGSAPIWLDGIYKINLTDANDVQQNDFPVDNFQNDTGAAGPAGTFPIATAAGTVDAITATYSPALTLANLTTCALVASGANATTTPTFAPNGLMAHTITKRGGVALKAGDIPGALSVAILEYNSANTRWELLNPQSEAFGTEQTVASATTTDLGALATNVALITGTTTITAFGSSASTLRPLYQVRFSGALTLTHNATSLILLGGANRTTVDGDCGQYLYLGSGNWKEVSYTKISGAPTIAPGTSGFVLQSNGTDWVSALNSPVSDRQTFTASGTWTKPSGYSSTAMVLIECWGAGGGGNGSNGGSSSLGSLVVAYGGSGGGATVGGAGGGHAATATAGVRDNLTGGEGFGATSALAANTGYFLGGGGGAPSQVNGAASVYGGGGGQANTGSGGSSQFGGAGGNPPTAPAGGGGTTTNSGGGGGSYKSRFLPLSSFSATESVTVGAGGAGGSGGATGARGEVRVTVVG